jgi:hypothetical protein
MFARVSQFAVRPERLEEGRRAIEDHVVPAIRMQLDYCGGLLLGNPETGKIVTVSLWEDEQAMHDTDEAAHWMRGFGAQEAGSTIETGETYEVYCARMSRPEPRSYQYNRRSWVNKTNGPMRSSRSTQQTPLRFVQSTS